MPSHRHRCRGNINAHKIKAKYIFKKIKGKERNSVISVSHKQSKSSFTRQVLSVRRVYQDTHGQWAHWGRKFPCFYCNPGSDCSPCYTHPTRAGIWPLSFLIDLFKNLSRGHEGREKGIFSRWPCSGVQKGPLCKQKFYQVREIKRFA